MESKSNAEWADEVLAKATQQAQQDQKEESDTWAKQELAKAARFGWALDLCRMATAGLLVVEALTSAKD